MPTRKELTTAVLTALKSLSGTGSSREIEAMVIEQLQLPDAVTKAIHNPAIGNRTELSYRLTEARHSLKRLGSIDDSTPGVWVLKTDAKGRDENNPPDSDPLEYFPMPKGVPFDPSSNNAKLISILYAFRTTGISEANLLVCYRLVSGKNKKQAKTDLDAFLVLKTAETAPYTFTLNENGLFTMALATQLKAIMPVFPVKAPVKSSVAKAGTVSVQKQAPRCQVAR